MKQVNKLGASLLSLTLVLSALSSSIVYAEEAVPNLIITDASSDDIDTETQEQQMKEKMKVQMEKEVQQKIKEAPTPISGEDEIEKFKNSTIKISQGTKLVISHDYVGYYLNSFGFTGVKNALYYEVSVAGETIKLANNVYEYYHHFDETKFKDKSEVEVIIQAVTYDFDDNKIVSEPLKVKAEVVYLKNDDDFDLLPLYVDAKHGDAEEAEAAVDNVVLAESEMKVSNVASTALAYDSISDNNSEEYTRYKENDFHKASETPLSTFSASVDTASFANARSCVTNGFLPDKDSIRIEEFLNYFDYQYPEPKNGDFSLTYTYTDCPWDSNSKILMMGIHAKEVAVKPSSNYTFLIDTSGSMDYEDKIELVRKSLKKLPETLTKNDTISIVTYSGEERILLNGATGNMVNCISDVADLLYADGATNGEAGIQMAYALNKSHFIKDGNNRVIMATDGDLNVGISDKDDLADFISEKRDTGIYLTMLGVGHGNLKDNKMQALAMNGNGNYYYIDSVTEAEKVLVIEANKTLVTIADDVKMQVEFNPASVSEYKLLGYESRKLENEDFTNDAKDAAEVGAGQDIVVMYEIKPNNGTNNTSLKYQTTTSDTSELCTFKLRYKKPGQAKSNEVEHIVKTASYVPYEKAGARVQFASSVVQLAMLLREGKDFSDDSYKNLLDEYVKIENRDLIGYYDQFCTVLDALAYDEIIILKDDEKLAVDMDEKSDVDTKSEDSLVPYDDDVSIDKPVIYLYPENDNTEVTVDLDLNGKFTAVYPEFTNSDEDVWNVVANKDGTIKLNNREYNYLYWEGLSSDDLVITKGTCVAKEDTIKFLEKKLTELGLTEKEQDDFISYWLPILNKNNYNITSFDIEQYEDNVQLKVSPQPDKVIRIFMTYQGVDEYIEVPEEIIDIDTTRKGFTVVEWGGGAGKFVG